MSESSQGTASKSSTKPAPQPGAVHAIGLTGISVLSLRVGKDGKALAFADIEIQLGSAGRLRVYGCAVMEGDKGLWVSWPRRKGEKEKWYDIVRPEGKLVQLLSAVVLDEYHDQFGVAGDAS